jgi:hypothetical protein
LDDLETGKRNGVLLQVIYRKRREENGNFTKRKKEVKIVTLPCGRGQGKLKQE